MGTRQSALTPHARGLLMFRWLGLQHHHMLAQYVALVRVSSELLHRLDNKHLDCLIMSVCRLLVFSSSHWIPTEPFALLSRRQRQFHLGP